MASALNTLVQQAIGTLHDTGQHAQAAAVQQLALHADELTAHTNTMAGLLDAATQLATIRAIDDIPWPGHTDHYPAL